MLFKKQYFVIGIIAIAAIIASFMLIPGSNELALMKMKDKHFEEARSAYEKEVANGVVDLESVNSLSDLYLQKGAVDKAIETLEKFVHAHPDNLPVRTKLGTLYQYAERRDDYLRNLEEINKIKPDADNLSTLSDIYNFRGEYNKQAQVLKDLIISEKGKNQKHFIDLANIQAANKDFTNAVATLRDMQKTLPDQFVFANEMFLVSLLFDNKQPDDAMKSASEWVAKHNDQPDDTAELINAAHYKGSIAMGEALIGHFSDTQINTNPKLLEAFTYLELSQGKDDEIFKRLQDMYYEKKLPKQLTGQLLSLSATHGDKKLLSSLLKEVSLNTIPESQVMPLIEIAINNGDTMLLAHITESFSGEENHKLYPLVSAALSIANRNNDAPNMLERLDSLGFSHEQSLQLARICAHYKDNECAFHLLGKLPDQSQLAVSEIATVGDIYLQLHDYDKGSDYLKEALKSHSNIEIEQVMAQFSAARGQLKDVETWIESHPDSINPHFLTNLYYSAYDNRQYNTAIRVAEIFRDKYHSELATSLLASAYVKSGKYESAIKLLGSIQNMSRDDEENYLAALVKLSSKKPGYHHELVNYAAKKLSSGKSPEKQRIAILHALININETDMAMPYIKEEAIKSGGEWNILYAELLDKKGLHKESHKFWMAAVHSPYTSIKERGSIAYVLLDNGYKDDAAPIFEALVLNPVIAPDERKTALSELLYIWGPRPEIKQMQWLEKRYADAKGQEKNRWAITISEHGTSEYLIGFIDRHPESIFIPKMADAYFEALADKHEMKSKVTYYITDAQKSGNTSLLRKFAEIAQDRGFKAEAGMAYKAIVKMEPSDYTAIMASGINAFEQADYTTSRNYLEDYINKDKSSAHNDPKAYIAYFHYAEILRRDGNVTGAKPFYRKTLALMNDNTADTSSNIAIKAQSQIWSGATETGLKTVDSAIAKYPDNDEIREAMIETLIESTQYTKAKALLKKSIKSERRAKSFTSKNLPEFATPVKEYYISRNNHELFIRFSGHVKSADIKATGKLPWISYINEGYDSVLIETLPEYKFHISSDKLKSVKKEDNTALQKQP